MGTLPRAGLFLCLAAATAAAGEDAAGDGKTVAEWQAVLAGKDERQRVRAAAALARMGAEAGAAIPDLAKALTGSPKNEDLRVNAALALGKIGGAGGHRLPHGFRLPRLPGAPEGEEGPPLPAEPPAEADPAAVERAAAVREHAVPALGKALRDACADVRSNAALSLGAIGKDAAAAAAPLAKGLADPSRNVRANAVVAFQTVPASPDLILPGLAKALTDADAGIADNAGRSLCVLGPAALPVLKDIRAALRRDCEKPRSTMDRVPGLGARVPIPAGSAFADFPTLSVNLCLALEAIGKEAAPALPEVFLALKSQNGPARNAALQAVDGIRSDPEKSVAAVVPLLQDPEEPMRGLAALVLGGFGPDARTALPALEKLRDASTGVVRKNCEAAIDRIAGKAVPTGAGEVQPADPGGATMHRGSGAGTVEVWR